LKAVTLKFSRDINGNMKRLLYCFTKIGAILNFFKPVRADVPVKFIKPIREFKSTLKPNLLPNHTE
jgi:hypothetical protein